MNYNKNRHIFIVGNSRSGTTMMGRILGSQESVFTFHELHFFEQLWTASDAGKNISFEVGVDIYAKLLKAQRSGILKYKDYRFYCEEASTVLKSLVADLTRESIFAHFLVTEAKENGKLIPCEQTPRNLLYLDEILTIFPDAKIIAMVRDPRDVLLSQKRKWKRRLLGGSEIPWTESFRSWVNYHPITISKLWNTNYQHIEKWRSHSSVIVVQFEKLIHCPEVELKRICDFLDLPFQENLLQIPIIGSSNFSDTHQTGIMKSALGNWKSDGLSQTEIFFCQRICKTGMVNAGYEIAFIKPAVFGLIMSFLSFPLKISGALLLNLKRMRNIKDSLKRRFMISR